MPDLTKLAASSPEIVRAGAQAFLLELMATARSFPWFIRFSAKKQCISAKADLRAQYCLKCLSPCPARSAFLKERRDAFLRVVREQVHAHHFFGVGVGFALIQVDLRIVGLFPQSHC